MATVNKDFKIKQGLVVEGTTATVNNFDVLTKKQADQDYIVGLIGGTATSANEANKVVKRDANGNFAAGTITATITGTVSSLSNHDTADLAENASNKYFTNQRALDATSAAYDATGSAAAAQSAAATDATNKANAAQTAAQTFATNADTAVRTAVTTEIGTAISTEVTNRNSAISAAIATEVTDRNSAISTAVANLVDAAPAALDTLNELAAALNDQVDATGLAVAIGNKLPLAGGTMSGAIAMGTSKITGLGNPTAAQDAATKTYVDGEVSSAASTASTAAADALTDANAYTDLREIAITTAYEAYADALDTDDVAEAGNQYFTDVRAKTSAAQLLTGANLTNITITGNGAGLTITAENGVADSNTDQLAEGTTNKYFTDARARTAVDGTTRSFTAVELNSVAKQVAATLSAPTAGIQTAHAFAKADYRSAEYLVKVAYSTHTEISKVLLTLDTSDNIAITEYGIVGTNGSASSISAGISGSDVQLQVTTTNNNSTVTVVGTLVK
jgi:hypothetical protein